MIYSINFTCQGRKFTADSASLDKALENQYEAIALGMILTEQEKAGIARGEKCVECSLIEMNETSGVSNVVWGADIYNPNSVQVE